MGVVNPAKLSFTSITPAAHDFVAGAAGYVDTDISADVPGSARVAVIRSVENGVGQSGVREAGSAITNNQQWGNGIWNVWCVGCLTRHVELYRHAATMNSYRVMGYFE